MKTVSVLRAASLAFSVLVTSAAWAEASQSSITNQSSIANKPSTSRPSAGKPSIDISTTSSSWRIARALVLQDDATEPQTRVAVHLLPIGHGYAQRYVQAHAFDDKGQLLAVTDCRRTPTYISRKQQQHGGDSIQLAFSQRLPATAHINLGIFRSKDCQPEQSASTGASS